MYVCMIDAKGGKCGCDDHAACSSRARGEGFCRDMRLISGVSTVDTCTLQNEVRSKYLGLWNDGPI